MSVLVVSGGTIEKNIIQNYYTKGDILIAVDKGLEAVLREGYSPEVIIGDFDSVDAGLKSFLVSNEEKTIRLHPVKDDTDTEAALTYVIEHYAGCEMILLGATGTRFDHTLANVYLLGKAKAAGISCVIIDAHNRMRLIENEEFSLKKEEQFGSYVSLLPIGGDAYGVSATGMKYPLSDATLHTFTSLGVSNEIVEDRCCISTKNGTLLVIESKDR